MGTPGLDYLELTDSGDQRGSSFPVPPTWFAEPFPLRDAHITTLLPGHIRGNHFHRARREIFVVIANDRWSLHWDMGEGTSSQSHEFEGPSAVVVRIQPQVSHAIRNDGSAILHLVGLTDGPYDPTAPDAFPRRVTSP